MGTAFWSARHVVLQNFCNNRAGPSAIPRRVFQFHKSHELRPAEWMRRLPGSGGPYLQCDRKLCSPAMVDGRTGRVLNWFLNSDQDNLITGISVRRRAA